MCGVCDSNGLRSEKDTNTKCFREREALRDEKFSRAKRRGRDSPTSAAQRGYYHCLLCTHRRWHLVTGLIRRNLQMSTTLLRGGDGAREFRRLHARWRECWHRLQAYLNISEMRMTEDHGTRVQ
jgi:hypothetical protein